MKQLLPFATLLLLSYATHAQSDLSARVDQQADSLEEQVIAWRHDIHEHPELSNREFKTAEKVAQHLRDLGMDVQTEVAHTGVVGVLKGGLPGPVVALRADMDGLPVTERGRHSLGVTGHHRVQRGRGRCDARLRPRHPCSNPDGRS